MHSNFATLQHWWKKMPMKEFLFQMSCTLRCCSQTTKMNKVNCMKNNNEILILVVILVDENSNFFLSYRVSINENMEIYSVFFNQLKNRQTFKLLVINIFVLFSFNFSQNENFPKLTDQKRGKRKKLVLIPISFELVETKRSYRLDNCRQKMFWW